MYEIWDYLSLIGIFLQIIGFLLLLPRFISWFDDKIENLDEITISLLSSSFVGLKLILLEEETSLKKQSQIKFKVKPFPPRIELEFYSKIKLRKVIKLMREGTGIFTVILGLCFHFASIILEKGQI